MRLAMDVSYLLAQLCCGTHNYKTSVAWHNKRSFWLTSSWGGEQFWWSKPSMAILAGLTRKGSWWVGWVLAGLSWSQLGLTPPCTTAVSSFSTPAWASSQSEGKIPKEKWKHTRSLEAQVWHTVTSTTFYRPKQVASPVLIQRVEK